MKKIFIGALFILFHLTINGIDLIPDFVGFWLVYSGMNELSAKSPSMDKSKPWALGLTVYAIVILVMQLYSLSTGTVYDTRFTSVLSICASLAMLYLSYCIVIGVRDLEEVEQLDLGSVVLLQIWKMQLVLQLVLVVLLFVAFFTFAALTIVTVLSVVTFVVELVGLFYFYKSMKRYNEAMAMRS